jgi:hypothetical protein
VKTVLIISYECRPYNRTGSTIGAQRVAQFAKHLPKFGWQAIVLCCDVNRRYTIDPKSNWKKEINIEISEKFNNLNANKSQPTESIIVSLPSLKYSSLFDYFWLKSVIHSKDNGTFSKREGILFSITRKLATLFKLFQGDHSQSWQPIVEHSFDIVQKSQKIDLIIAEHGPDASIFTAFKINHKYQIPWVVDFRDPYFQPLSRFQRLLCKNYLTKIIKKANATINVNKPWAELDFNDFKLPSFVIPNGFDNEDFDLKVPLLKDWDNKLIIWYGGNLIPQQNIDVFFEGLHLAILNKPELEKFIQFEYRGGLHEKFMDVAKKNDLVKISNIKPSINRESALELMMNANILLIFSTATYSKGQEMFYKKGFYPGKIFEYMMTRKLVISTPGDYGILDNLIEKCNLGITLRDKYQVRDYFLNLDIHASNFGIKYPSYNLHEVEKYSRSKLAGDLSMILNNVTK